MFHISLIVAEFTFELLVYPTLKEFENISDQSHLYVCVTVLE